MSILAALHLDSPDSLKRAIASALGFLVLVLVNPFLVAKDLPPLSDANLLAAAGVLSTFVFQSGANTIARTTAEGAAAAAAVVTPADAAKVLAAEPVKP